MSEITAEEFEKAYAERSGVTVQWLRQHGRVVRRCKCDYEGCEGWKSVRSEPYVAAPGATVSAGDLADEPAP